MQNLIYVLIAAHALLVIRFVIRACYREANSYQFYWLLIIFLIPFFGYGMFYFNKSKNG